MNKLMMAVASSMVAPVLVLAQGAGQQVRGEGYIFFGPIVSNTQLRFNPACYTIIPPLNQTYPSNCYTQARGGVNAGFGGELFLHKGLSVGVEPAYAGPGWSFNRNEAVGVMSFNGSYHFFNTKRGGKFEPFVTGGYSLYCGGSGIFRNGLNIGGGVNVWLSKHAGVRLEIRDQDHIERIHNSQFTRFAAFRVGMTFR
jgi:hypothetical protein